MNRRESLGGDKVNSPEMEGVATELVDQLRFELQEIEQRYPGIKYDAHVEDLRAKEYPQLKVKTSF